MAKLLIENRNENKTRKNYIKFQKKSQKYKKIHKSAKALYNNT
jgi:hypothetical protein